MTRYEAATQHGEYFVWDTVGKCVVRDASGPLVFGSPADTVWYAGELNKLRTPAEILAGI